MTFNPNQARAKNGMWEGAGGDKGSHAAGTNSVGKTLVSPKVVDVIRQNPGGFSVSPDGKIPSRGYMVSVAGRTKILDEHALAGEGAHSIINDYARQNADVLKTPGAHIGGWTDKGKVYLDVSHNVTNQRAAVKAGKMGNQIAIWDVKRQREIRTGGTGK